MKKYVFAMILFLLIAINVPVSFAATSYYQGVTINTDCAGYTFSITNPNAPKFIKVWGGDLGVKYAWGQYGTPTTGLMRGYFITNGVRSTTSYRAIKDTACN